MKAPNNVKKHESDLSTFWFDEDGILRAVAKRCIRTLETQKRNFNFIASFTEHKQVCLLADTSEATPLDRESREFTAQELPKLFKAMAIISISPLGRFIANGFLAVNKQPIPIKFFTNEQDARDWLKQFL
ncbi:MAG TPA: STAS/SEC14 domain-containing protein [Bacteroidia bacterium]|jgi:hypothetical protein